jgi:AcrR family transcriptional regulator
MSSAMASTESASQSPDAQNAWTLDRALSVGAQLFAEKGYAATTTRELSRALGITNGTFYHYFSSKEELLVRICQHSINTMTRSVQDAMENVETGAGLKRLIGAHVASMLSEQDLHKTMLTEIRSLSGEYLNRVVKLRDDYEHLVRSAIQSEQDAGRVREDLSASVLTLLLLNMLNWTILWYKPTGPLDEQALADMMVTTFIDGAAPRPSPMKH